MKGLFTFVILLVDKLVFFNPVYANSCNIYDNNGIKYLPKSLVNLFIRLCLAINKLAFQLSYLAFK